MAREGMYYLVSSLPPPVWPPSSTVYFKLTTF
jgi:hypothetical protein